MAYVTPLITTVPMVVWLTGGGFVGAPTWESSIWGGVKEVVLNVERLRVLLIESGCGGILSGGGRGMLLAGEGVEPGCDSGVLGEPPRGVTPDAIFITSL
ncbi:MAG: hypothetical protein MRY21_08290 [Simkaniaceae bacterium]|nr:hypothetical protein [Simkaniaceae bacterium]